MAVASTTRTRDDQRSAREIQRDIEAKRHEMDQTLDEIGERLHPRRLFDVAVDYLRSAGDGSSSELKAKARGAGRQVGRQLKEHPLPLLLIGAGLVWWLMEDAEDDGPSVLDELPSYRFRDRAEEDAAWESAPRLPVAWDDDYDWSAAEHDEQTWSQRAQAAIDELRSALDANDVSEEERIRTAATHLSGISGWKRRELHSQWADLREHSGSVVDARTGEPYDESYGHEWQSLAGTGWTVSEGEHPEGHSGWKERAQGTIQKLRDSLSDTSRSVKHKLQDAANHLTDFARQTGGRAGQWAGESRSRAGHWADQARGQAQHLAGRGRHAAGRSRHALEHGYAQAAEGARHAAHRTREGLADGYTAAREGFDEAVEQYPLAVGAAAFGLGLLAGMLVPETRQENRLMGQAADQTKRKAQEFGEEVAHRGMAAVQAATGAVSEELKQHGVTVEHAKEVAKDTVHKATQVAKETAGKATEAAKQEASGHGTGHDAGLGPEARRDTPQKTQPVGQPTTGGYTGM